MSKKKTKKETVKRKTSIYDPMGVYGRGITENQRLGMIRRMKIENIRDPVKVLTQKDLEEYQKILIYYGVPTVPTVPTSPLEIRTITIVIPMEFLTTDITNEKIYNILEQKHGITPFAFYCDSFSITRSIESLQWLPFLQPFIEVGESGITGNLTFDENVISDRSNFIVTFPAYWIDGTVINYFSLVYDRSSIWASVKQSYDDVFGDFTLLPRNSTMIPYLMYPNDDYPRMHFGVNFVGAIIEGFQICVRIRVLCNKQS